MSSTADPARARIRGFSRAFSLAAAGVMLLVLPFVFPLLGGSQPPYGGGFDGWPWERADPAVAERNGDTWVGADAALIELRDLDTSRPLQIDPVREDGRYLPLVATAPGGAPAPTGDRIDLSHYHSYHYLVPWRSDIDLWSYRDETGPWSVTVTAPELPDCGGRVEGSGGAVFVYRGDATSARFVADDQLTYSTVTTELGTDYLGTEYPYQGPYDMSVAWDDTPYAVFVIAEGRADWSTEWSLVFDEHGSAAGDAGPSCVFPVEPVGIAAEEEQP
ncbi:hypothetical protein NHL51_11710 [Leucobacter sp. gxy201]|uniref:hypothetical protein n=1 Tax=Leucobacter sp. gxy201 TaxID=2957200 RepID=UPI003DA1532E